MKRAATADEVIYSLQVALEKESRNTSEISDLVRHVLKDRKWGEFHSFTGVARKHESFREFVISPRYEGLGTTRDGLLAIIRLEDEELAGQVERAWREDVAPVREKAGRPSINDGGTDIRDKRGQADGILARLKRDDPMTAQAVVNGDLTANAAARIKGWRKPRILLTTPESVAKRIKENYTPEEVEELIRYLT